jgi:membrane protease YdiL (CAAX protease family)
MSESTGGTGPGETPVSESSFLTEPPQRDLRWVFLGPQGVRAGWSVLIFAGIFIALLFGLSAVLVQFIHEKPNLSHGMPPLLGFINEVIQVVAVVVATWVMARIEGKPLLAYGYQGQARGVRFVSGLVWGFAAISALVFSLEKLGYLVIDGRALGGAAALHYALVWGGVFLLVAFFEESIMRGYLQYTLTRGIGFWWSAILLSFLFGFGHGHNPGESPVGLLAAGLVGLVWCLSLWYTGSLWWAVGLHAGWDWGESYFYGTADSGVAAQGHLLREHPVGAALWSGGSTGPEGSVLVFPLLALMVVLMVLWWGRRGERPFRGMGWRGR